MVASGICTAWKTLILEFLFGVQGSPWSAPATLYFGLCTACDDAGTVTGEPVANGYTRKEITNDTSLWNESAAGAIDNKAAITFATASGAGWGALDTFFIANHGTNTGAAIIAYGTLTVEKTITSGDTPSFAAGDLDISLTSTT